MLSLVFDPTVSLGSLIHLVVLVSFIYFTASKATRRLKSIEVKLDRLPELLKKSGEKWTTQ